MLTKFPHWPFHDEDEISAVASTLSSGKTNQWTSEEVNKFGDEYAQAVGTAYAIPLANGTLALELALRALDIGPGDEVIVTPKTFLASVSSVVLMGATPIFADIDPDSQNVTAETIAAVLTKKTKAIVVVHLGGWPCEMDPIMALAKKHNFKVIEDCAQAHGATYKGRQVGSIGDIGAFSFCQDKIITTGGEGGLVTTNDKAIWSKMWSFKDHGKNYDLAVNQKGRGEFRWVHTSFGSNYRLTAPQAAIGRIQLTKLKKWVSTRNINAAELIEGFAGARGIRVATPPNHMTHAYYRVYAHLDLPAFKANTTRDKIVEDIRNLGVPCFSGSCSEVYLEGAFENTGFRPAAALPNAKASSENSLAFLVHPTLGKAEMQKTRDAVLQVINRYLK